MSDATDGQLSMTVHLAATIPARETTDAIDPSKGHTFPGLDVLRGWGAIAVLALHAFDPFGPSFLKSGYIALDIFFVMSGFVIAHTYDNRIPTLGVFGFLRIRALRFYPLLALGLAIGVFRSLILIPLSHASYSVWNVLQALLCNLLFLPAPPLVMSSIEISPINGPVWSMLFEMAANLAYAALFPWLSLRSLIVVTAVSLAALAYWSMLCHGLIVGPGWPTIGGGAARIGFSFPLGILIYRLNLRRIRLGFLVLPGLLATFCLGGSTWTDLALVALASPALVVIASRSIPRWASLAAYLSGISYCLYAIHAPILMLVQGACNRLGVPAIWPTIATIGLLLVACPLLDRWYDRPVRRWLTAITARHVVIGAPR